MSLFFKQMCVFLLSFTIIMPSSFASSSNVEGLTYVVSHIEKPPFPKNIKKNYNLYEFYIANNSFLTFSIPGYSVDLGVETIPVEQVFNMANSGNRNKLAILNLATSAASIVFGGGLVVTAGRLTYTAAQGITSIKSKKNSVPFEALSQHKTYILYPGDQKSIFIFVRKPKNKKMKEFFKPKKISFICKNEETQKNHVVINKGIFNSKFDVGGNLGSNVYNLDDYQPVYIHDGSSSEYDYYNPSQFNRGINDFDKDQDSNTKELMPSSPIIISTPSSEDFH